MSPTKLKASGRASGERPRRRLEYLPLADIPTAELNPKQHDPEAIARSINRFGFVEPVTLDERTGRLIAGHGRLEMLQAAEAEGLDPPEGVVVGDGGGWLLPVTRGWTSRSDAEAHALGVALNQTTILGGFDSQQLAALVQDLNGEDEELVAALGFADHDLSVLLSAVLPDFTPPDVEPLGGFDPTGAQTIRVMADEHEAISAAVERCREIEADDDLTTGAALKLICDGYGL